MTCSRNSILDRTRDIEGDLGNLAGIVLAVLHGLQIHPAHHKPAAYRAPLSTFRLTFAASWIALAASTSSLIATFCAAGILAEIWESTVEKVNGQALHGNWPDDSGCSVGAEKQNP